MELTLYPFRLRFRHTFTISRKSKDVQPLLVAELRQKGYRAIALKALNSPGQIAPVDSSAKVPEPTAPTEEVEVRRAEPAKPMEQAAPVDSPIKLDPPAPLQF